MATITEHSLLGKKCYVEIKKRRLRRSRAEIVAVLENFRGDVGFLVKLLRGRSRGKLIKATYKSIALL